MIPRIRIFAIISAACLLAVAPPALAQLDTATVKGMISIQLPKGWPPAAGRSLLSAQVPQADKESGNQFQATLILTQDAAAGPIDGAAQQRRLAQQYPSYHSLEQPATLSINGIPCISFGGTFTSNGIELRTRQYMFPINNQLYILTFTSLNSRWGAYQANLEACAATFSVKR